MSDKAQMPRMREQWKDNAIEATKNEPAKVELKQEEIRAKAENIKEQAEKHDEPRRDDRSELPEEFLGDGCDCGCGCE